MHSSGFDINTDFGSLKDILKGNFRLGFGFRRRRSSVERSDTIEFDTGYDEESRAVYYRHSKSFDDDFDEPENFSSEDAPVTTRKAIALEAANAKTENGGNERVAQMLRKDNDLEDNPIVQAVSDSFFADKDATAKEEDATKEENALIDTISPGNLIAALS